jgi:hypothetical protein
MQTFGNIDLVKLHKTAFPYSRKAPASAVLKRYDRATAMCEAGECVVSGFHSPLERDVLHFPLKGRQPVILVPGRTMYVQLPEELDQPFAD